ncbi:MAG: hypothetical protein N2249_03905 [Melioribacter sp.]|nr:hypothetical protein [Melioribacter sp.]
MLKSISRILIGIIFIFSAYTKLVSPGIVEIILVDHNIFSTREIAGFFVRVLIGIEFAIGTLFILNIEVKRFVIPISIIFLFLFTAYLVYSGYVLGDKQNCGCFGEVITMSPFESMIKNVCLLILIFFLYKSEKKEQKKNFYIPIAITIAITIGIFIVSPIKSVKNFKFSQYTFFEGKGRVDLTEGEKFIVILNTGCEHCQELAKELATFKFNPKISSKIYALVYTEDNISIDSFKTLTKFDYPYYKIDLVSFFDLIGKSPPRIYWLKNGTIKEVWDSNFVKNINNIK